jgi:hypothetical protein
MPQEDQLFIFELGAITINGKQIYLEEITLNVTRDLAEYYTTDSFDAKEIRPGRKKIDFTIRKAKDMSGAGQTFLDLFLHTQPFQMTLYAMNMANEECNPRPVAALQGCRLSKNQLGNFDGSKPVQEDIEGKAQKVIYYDKDNNIHEASICNEING